jgi:serine/threonine protein kinase
MSEPKATTGKGRLTGSRLGDYELRSLLGAGGMGEVYRARDSRLARDVAVKVLSGDLASDPARLRRFEKEAQAASALNHPSILAVYEIGASGGTSWIAMELVEGKTLRQLLSGGPLTMRKALEIGVAVAEGLSRAHEAGIVHRDLKPENVMVNDDGVVKILDFGLAKWMRSPLAADAVTAEGEGDEKTTLTFGTEPGTLLGTVRYMSPEQASGKELDFRSDQFSFGSLLYEMVTGQSAFGKDMMVDTLSAIVYEEPDPPGRINPKVPAPIGWFIERCLAKEPKDRYAATRDLARDLAKLRDHLSELSSATGIPLEVPKHPGMWRAIGLAAAVLLALAGTLFLGRRIERAQASSPRFRQLTFRGAGIGTARFAPDGQSVVFSAQTEGKPPELLLLRLDSPETRSLGLPPAHVLSISTAGEMAILLPPPFALGPRIGHMASEQLLYRDPLLLDGILADASLSGGAPRELLEDVLFADWAPNGKDLAVVHRAGDGHRVEFPIGKTISDEERVLFNHPRISRAQPLLAFKDWGAIFLKDAGNPSHLIPGPVDDLLGVSDSGWGGHEIAWAGGEIWYTIGAVGWNLVGATEIHAVTPRGRDRLVATMPGDFILYDIAADGRVLLGRLVESTEILGSFPDDPRARNLSYFDSSRAVGLSARGDSLLFADVSRFVFGSAYVRKTDESPARRLADGSPYAISPDGRLVLGIDMSATGPAEHLTLIPTGSGETRKLEDGGVGVDPLDDTHAGFFPDGRRIFFPGAEANRGWRVWVQDIAGGKPRPVTSEHVRRPVLLGDSHFICARAADLAWYLYPVDEKAEPRKALGILPGEEPIQSTPEGLLYVRGADELRPGEKLMTTRIYRLDPRTGRRELWKEIPPANPRTGGAISTILFSADGKTCVWTHIRYSVELILAEGLK